jgi:hypothetical protein
MDKRSSLLIKFINYGEKKFYNIGPRIDYSRKKFYDEDFAFELSSIRGEETLIPKPKLN